MPWVDLPPELKKAVVYVPKDGHVTLPHGGLEITYISRFWRPEAQSQGVGRATGPLGEDPSLPPPTSGAPSLPRTVATLLQSLPPSSHDLPFVSLYPLLFF